MSTGNSGTFGLKMGKPVLYQEDFRGITLCFPCWNQLHFSKRIRRVACQDHKRARPEEHTKCKLCRWVETGGQICNCILGHCECPCSRMEQNRAELTFAKKQAKKETAKSQMHILDSGCGTIEVK